MHPVHSPCDSISQYACGASSVYPPDEHTKYMLLLEAQNVDNDNFRLKPKLLSSR